jgi:Aconitase family (aconitate hydratase)
VWALGEMWLEVPASLKVVYHGASGCYVMGKDLILALIRQLTIDDALYQAMEFTGPTLARVGMSERLTICNMAVTRQTPGEAPRARRVMTENGRYVIYAPRRQLADPARGVSGRG